jgi:uncharacterized protein (DUF433 family)
MRTKKTPYKHIRLWPDGTPTVSGTRLKVKHVAAAYRGGASAEEIQQMYPDHTLGEIFSALAYYLDRKDEMHRAMDADEREAVRLWEEIQVRQGPSPTRQELEERLRAAARAR